MSGQTPAESAMADKLVTALALDSVSPTAIAPLAPLFGSGPDGLGLDSIDALEIALMIQQQYGVELRSDDPGTKSAFTSLRSLTAYVTEKRAAA